MTAHPPSVGRPALSRRGLLQAAGLVAGAAALGAAVPLMQVLPAYGRDSAFTRRGTGPMYWSSYGYQFVHGALDEGVWQTNIDWVATNLASYGFVEACTDGWVGGPGTPLTANGYLTRHNSAWTHDWAYWASYLSGKGMQLGVYYNPMWMETDAYTANLPIVGSTHHTQDIVGTVDFDTNHKWVDPSRPGAKEWIQGYIAYFISVGAKHLIIDFIGAGITGTVTGFEDTYGSTAYAQALQWIAQAAGDQLFVALSMPNMYNHGANELAYADMVRISDDPWQGNAWIQLSSNDRGNTHPAWPTHFNSFDGLVDFSDLSGTSNTGNNRLILDPCFPHMANFASDAERRCAISLFAISGSPISFADQYNTIGTNLWCLQNAEVNTLNAAGFVGKPRTRDFTSADSQVWRGRLSTGEWIVGLFNRESTAQNRSITFTELGITGAASVRDLWSHTNLGSMTSFSATVGIHDVRLLKITPGGGTWETVASAGADSPAVTAQNSGRLDVFTRATAGGLAWQSWTGTWSAMTNLGGPTGSTFTGKPAVASWADGRMDAFVRGTTGAIYHTWYTGGAWSGTWENLGGTGTESPAATSWGSNHLAVFIRGSDNQLYVKSWTGSGWTAWTALGGPTSGVFTSAPSAACWSSGRIDVFVRGTDNAVWHRWYAGGAWSTSWENLAGYTTYGPAAASAGTNIVSVTVHGGDNQLWTKSLSGATWSGWAAESGPTSGSVGADPSIVSRRGTGTTDYLVKGTDGTLYRRTTI